MRDTTYYAHPVACYSARQALYMSRGMSEKEAFQKVTEEITWTHLTRKLEEDMAVATLNSRGFVVMNTEHLLSEYLYEYNALNFDRGPVGNMLALEDLAKVQEARRI